MELVDKDALVAEIKRRKDICKKVVWDLRTQENKDYYQGKAEAYSEMADLINTIEAKGVDLDKQAEWIANGIMIAVQSAKLHTNVYNPDRKDYDHSHLMQAARRGIELGLKIAQKGEEV